MTQTPLDIDRVVREVLAELKPAPAMEGSSLPSETPGATAGLSSSAVDLNAMSSEQTTKSVMSATSEKGDLVLSTRLVTLADITGRLQGIRRVVVGPRTVVTPAVRDALRQRNIMLSNAMPTPNPSAKSVRLVIVAVRTKIDPKPLANTLQSQGIEVQYESSDCLIDATDRLAGELTKGNALGLLMTPHTAEALCLANRIAGLRAVLANDGNSLEADASAVGANLLVIDPQRVGFFKLCQMAGEYCRNGVRPCPEVLRKRLM